MPEQAKRRDLDNRQDHIRVNDQVRLKHGDLIGTVTGWDWRTYLCDVTWKPGPHGWSTGRSVVHEMYLERV